MEVDFLKVYTLFKMNEKLFEQNIILKYLIHHREYELQGA